jgi:hypothetical protein
MKEMVYIVFKGGEWSDQVMQGVYRNEADAEEFCNKQKNQNLFYYVEEEVRQ